VVLEALSLREISANGSVHPQEVHELINQPLSLRGRSLDVPACKTAALLRYLKEEIFPQLAPPPYAEIEIERLSHRKQVYLFHEKANNIAAVGKLFKDDFIPLEEAWQSAEREYFNLRVLRERFGMDSNACRVVAPLGKNRKLSAMLVMEKAPGRTLDYYIAKAVYEQKSQRLFDKLSHLARFFVKLHRNSENDKPVSHNLPHWYLGELLNSFSQTYLSPFQRNAIERYATQWWDRNDILTADREVIVHGDATPTNFLFADEGVTGIDLERMKWADRCWDLGFVAAELKHHFAWRMGNGWAAEPYIGHFLWEYTVNYQGDTQFFHGITRKIPLYMALGLLRIARNPWLDESYRKGLLFEARQCLKYGL
jgi:aminoglycoside phosphotransferase (APT) family kinase protein